MLESDLINVFLDICLPQVAITLCEPKLRLYMREFPVVYKKQHGRIDVVLDNGSTKMFLLEFKKDTVRHGPVDQLQFYRKALPAVFANKNIEGWLVAENFSNHEVEEAHKQGFKCLQLDMYAHFRFISDFKSYLLS